MTITSDDLIATADTTQLDTIADHLDAVRTAAVAVVDEQTRWLHPTRRRWPRRNTWKPQPFRYEDELAVPSLSNLVAAVERSDDAEALGTAERIDVLWPVFIFSWRITRPATWANGQTRRVDGRTDKLDAKIAALDAAVAAADTTVASIAGLA